MGEDLSEIENLASALDTAARICVCQYPDRPGRRSWLGRKLAVLRLRHLTEDAREFGRYVQLHLKVPEFWIPESAGHRRLGQMPRTLSAVSSLMLMGLSEAEAWDYPVGKGEWFKAARAVHTGDTLDFIEPDKPETLEKVDILKREMPALCNALRLNGDAVTPAQTLYAANLIIQQAFDLVCQWQAATGAKRTMLLRELEAELPDLTLDD